MLGSIIVALVTISLIFTGVYLGNNQDNPGDAEETGSYDEGFFGSLDALVGGLEKSAERGEATKEDRYQEYLRIKENSIDANTKLQSYSPRTPSVKSSTRTQFQTTVPAMEGQPVEATKATSSVNTIESTSVPRGEIKVSPPKPTPVPEPVISTPPPSSPSVETSDLNTLLDELFSSFSFEDDFLNDPSDESFTE